MPIYDYTCHKCGHTYEDMNTIAARDIPCGLPCVECGELAVKRDVPLTTMGADATLNADKATGGQWSELVDKMAKSTPKRYDNLERSKSFGGGKLGPR